MAYHGYIPSIKKFLSTIEVPSVLEVGLDRGVTTIPIVNFMLRHHKSFNFIGVDVMLQESLLITLNNLDFANSEQNICLMHDSSLNVLPQLVKDSRKFNVVLLDGDHNYYTVSKELAYLDSLAAENALVIIDDYHGRWAEQDLWYAESEGYEKAQQATKRVETEKSGVKPAVDEFLQANSTWDSLVPIHGEPIVLYRKQKEASTTL